MKNVWLNRNIKKKHAALMLASMVTLASAWRMQEDKLMRQMQEELRDYQYLVSLGATGNLDITSYATAV